LKYKDIDGLTWQLSGFMERNLLELVDEGDTSNQEAPDKSKE